MPLFWRFGACSDIGRTRRKNDDSAYAGPHLLVVADGMGGAAAGDLASTVAVDTLQRLDVAPPENLLEALAGTLHRANDRLAELVEEDPSIAGMGTTVTAALFDGERIGVAHLGDSRGYLWRGGELQQLTTDHTWVQTLVDEGRITEAEARFHSHRSLLLKVLDGQHDHDPDLALYDVRAGDRILLCSDGLSGFVEPERIAQFLSQDTSADTAARELTSLALKAASNDNVTVVVADVVDAPPPEAAPIVVGAAAEPSRGVRSRLRTWPSREVTPAGKSLLTDPDFDPEELRYAPRPPRRFAALRRLAASLVLAAVVVAGGVAAYRWSQQQYYVAPYHQRVAIYRGVQASLPGVRLHSVYQSESLRLSELPSFRRSQVVEGMAADSLQHARRIVGNLNSFARACSRLLQRISGTSASTQSGTSTATQSQTPPPTPASSPVSTGRAPSKQPPATRHHRQSAKRGHSPATGKSSPSTPKPSSTSPTTVTPTTGSSTVRTPEQARECAGATPPTSPTAVTETTR